MKTTLEIVGFLVVCIVGYFLWGVAGVATSVFLALVGAGISLLGLATKLITLLGLALYAVCEFFTDKKDDAK